MASISITRIIFIRNSWWWLFTQLAWKIYLVAGACLWGFFLFVLIGLLVFPPPPELAGTTDSMMEPFFLVATWGFSGIVMGCASRRTTVV
nr:hypothetical protein [Candidatus Sigynarchaeota archaeon]